jgi:hypothetical protein
MIAKLPFVGRAAALGFAAGRRGTIELTGFQPRTGGHCESAAMLNALAYLGYPVTEADIVGGGGAPSFIFTNDAFPFIGGRGLRMREAFLESARIPCGAVLPEGGKADWEPVARLLDRGIPVLLRVDMRWLPYLYGGRYGSPYMSFGGHWVCLFGLDFDSGQALVTDTANEGRRVVKIADLAKARLSGTKAYPPRGEYAWIGPKPEAWDLDADGLTRDALAQVLENYGSGAGSAKYPAAPLIGLSGLAAFPEALASIHSIVRPYALAPAYSFMAGSIERNGTGGAAFRRLFRDFLAARAADCADRRLRSACSALVAPTEAAMAAWSALASAFDEAAAALGSTRGRALEAAISAAEAVTAELARVLYLGELALRDAIAAADLSGGN